MRRTRKPCLYYPGTATEHGSEEEEMNELMHHAWWKTVWRNAGAEEQVRGGFA